ncbi:MAG: MOSC domain-containing protein [Deltaproteobacteria bacterium]
MPAIRGKVIAVCTSERKGEKKRPVPSVTLVPDLGVERDAHAGPWHRQVSLLAVESIAKMRAKGLSVGPGDFAENITVEGVDLVGLKPGDRLLAGEALLEITQIGKECHNRCAIYYQAGDCVMPKEGVFARVLRGGTLRAGDPVEKE